MVSFEHIPGVQPNFTLDEFHEVDVAMRKHPDVIAALAERGFTDIDLIPDRHLDLCQSAHAEVSGPQAGLVRPTWARATPEGNPTAIRSPD